MLNTATRDEMKWGRAAAGLAKELERSTALGVGGVCFHPGAATDGDRAGGDARVARAITQALSAVKGTTRMLVENTAGAGLTIGRTPEEVGAILGACRPRCGRARATGSTPATSSPRGTTSRRRRGATAMLDEFEAATGEPPAFFHLNDSEGALGSNRDRHVLIGEGKIGAEPFRWLLKDRRSGGVPLILETPQERSEMAEDDATPIPTTCA